MKLGDVNRKTSESSLPRNVAHQRIRSFVRNRAQTILELVFPNRFKPRVARSQPVTVYASPRLTKLTTEQAKLKLLGHLSVGDQGAKDLLDLVFPDRSGNSAAPEQETPALHD